MHDFFNFITDNFDRTQHSIYKDHWDPGLFNMLDITFDFVKGLSVLSIVYLDQLTGARHTHTYLITIFKREFLKKLRV